MNEPNWTKVIADHASKLATSQMRIKMKSLVVESERQVGSLRALFWLNIEP